MKHFAIAAAAAVGLAASAHAAPLFSFESGLEGFVYTQNAVTLAPSTTGATDGAGSLAVTFSGYVNYGADISMDSWTDIYTNRKVALDYTLTEQNLNYWLQVNVAVMSTNGGWQNPGSWTTGSTAPGTYTVEFDLSSVDMPADPGSVHRLYIMHNTGGTASTHYVDNIRIVPIPEPASLGLLAGASLLLMRQRRH